MLTEVKAFSSWRSAPTLPLSVGGRAETDLIQILNIDGLDPVKASVNTSPYGAVDGASYTGSSVLSRDIVLTLHPNPNWNEWTYESLRRLIYSYFMPKRLVKLIFYSDDMIPVQILGIVEEASVNMFTKDPEIQVSVICPDPYFSAVDGIVLTGLTNDAEKVIEYNGNIEAGIYLQVAASADPAPAEIAVQIGAPASIYYAVDATVDTNNYFELSTIPMRKYVQNVNLENGVITSLLSNVHVQEGSSWPMLQPGENEFTVITDTGDHDWQLTYFERFGGL